MKNCRQFTAAFGMQKSNFRRTYGYNNYYVCRTNVFIWHALEKETYATNFDNLIKFWVKRNLYDLLKHSEVAGCMQLEWLVRHEVTE